MKKVLCAILALVLLLSLCACGQKAKEPATWQEQYDLGMRYLNEGNYEQAILAFEAAIELNPEQADIYMRLAETHVALGNTVDAVKVLEQGLDIIENTELALYLAALKDEGSSEDNTELSSPEDDELVAEPVETTTRTERVDWPDVGRYTIKEYDENGNNIRSTTYKSSTDEMLWYYIDEFNDANQCVKSIGYKSDGTINGWTIYEYSNGNWTRQTRYDADGTVKTDCIYEYDENNIHVRSSIYKYGVLDYIVEFDESGSVIRTTYYKQDGSIKNVVE